MATKPPLPLPDMPPIGLPEADYARLSHHAEKVGDVHAKAAYKVAQYVSLGLDPKLRWPQKLRYFEHALHRHCNPPPLPEEAVWLFYRSLASLIRDHCGAEALRLTSKEDDVLAKRLHIGLTVEQVKAEAKVFFSDLMGRMDKCPDHFHEDDWHALHVFREQWL